MTASGEARGRLEPMLEREFSTFTAVIILSILLPILQINTLAMG